MKVIYNDFTLGYVAGAHVKDNPFEWEGTYEEFLEIPYHSYITAAENDFGSFYKKDYIKYKCEDCGEEVVSQIASLYHFKERVEKGTADSIQEGFLCKSCKTKRIYQRDYGVDNPQQLEEVKKANKKTFYENHPELSPYTEEVIEYEGTLKDLIENYHYQWNRIIRFKCTRCGKIEEMNYGALSYRYKSWSESGRSLEDMICKKCAKQTAVHPDMIPLQEEPIFWKDSLENLIKQPFYDKQKIKFICKRCGKEEIKTFGNLRWRNKYRDEEGFSTDLYCEECQAIVTSEQKYGVKFVNQRHLSKETLEIVENKDKLQEFVNQYKEYNSNYIANKLNISETTLCRYLRSYNIVLPQGPRSSDEQEICDLLDANNIKYITNRKDIIPPLELDIYIPDLKIAIEFNGNYWHSEENLDRHSISAKIYHQQKSFMCREKGIRLVHIFEYEWRVKKDLIIEYLKNVLCINKTISIKNNFRIKEISNEEFQEFNKLYSFIDIKNIDVNLGLFFNEELISVLSFNQLNKDEYEIVNLTNNIYKHVENGSYILLNYFIQNYNPKYIKAFIDFNKNTGDLYESLGFVFSGKTRPDYVWVKNNEFIKRRDMTKDPENYMKIYDAGFLIFKWFKN